MKKEGKKKKKGVLVGNNILYSSVQSHALVSFGLLVSYVYVAYVY